MPEPERSRRDREDRPESQISQLCHRREAVLMPLSIERSTTTSAITALTIVQTIGRWKNDNKRTEANIRPRRHKREGGGAASEQTSRGETTAKRRLTNDR